jgi:hypothetical protein
VLPRVSQALVKFFEPLATTIQAKTSTQNERERRPELKLVSQEAPPPPAPAPEAETTQVSLKETPSPPPSHPLFTLIQNQLNSLSTWRAFDAYQTSLKSRKKGARFKKGAVFDQKAE